MRGSSSAAISGQVIACYNVERSGTEQAVTGPSLMALLYGFDQFFIYNYLYGDWTIIFRSYRYFVFACII